MRYNCSILGVSFISLNFMFLCSTTSIVTASLVLMNSSKISLTLDETQMWCFRALLCFVELYVFMLIYITCYSQSCSMNYPKIPLTPNETELKYFSDQLHFQFSCNTLEVNSTLVQFLFTVFQVSLIAFQFSYSHCISSLISQLNQNSQPSLFINYSCY